jgi:hypothetical protein
MSDTTDTALATSVAVGLALCGFAIVGYIVRASCFPNRMKISRSDNDLENLQDLVADSIPTNR